MSQLQPFGFHHDCPDCGKSISITDSRRKRCGVCWAIYTMAHEERKLKPRFCKHCDVNITDLPGLRRVCNDCAKIPVVSRPRYFPALNDNEKSRALTKYAVKIGFLPSPKNFPCNDCGRPAECYDHRDYTKPLEVEPVCIRCNTSRGKGIPLHLNH